MPHRGIITIAMWGAHNSNLHGSPIETAAIYTIDVDPACRKKAGAAPNGAAPYNLPDTGINSHNRANTL